MKGNRTRSAQGLREARRDDATVRISRVAMDKLSLLQPSVLFIALVLIQPAVCLDPGDYKGCFPEKVNRRCYGVNPGQYDPAQMNPEVCTSKCGVYKYNYAALTSSNSSRESFCFCGNATVNSTWRANDAECQSICAGDTASKCGGAGHVSLYATPQVISGPAISATDGGPFWTDTTVRFRVSVESGTDVYYQIDYDDGAGLSPKMSLNLNQEPNRTFRVPGNYSVRVVVADLKDLQTAQLAVRTVTVYERLETDNLTINCHSTMVTWQEHACNATVWRGTSLKFVSRLQCTGRYYPEYERTFDIADPVFSAVGPGIPDTPGSMTRSSNSSAVVLALAWPVQGAGRVLGWELGVNGSGTFTVLVLSPTGVSTGVYCPVSSQCFLCTGSSANRPAVNCNTAGSTFCPARRLCRDNTTQTCPAPVTYAPYYRVRKVVNVYASGNGYQYVKELTQVDVSPGDVFGVDFGATGPGPRLSVLDCPADRANVRLDGVTMRLYDDTRYFSSATPTGDCLALRAIVSGGSQVRLPFKMSSAGNCTIDITIGNTPIGGIISPLRSFVIDVVEGINFTIISGPKFAKTGSPTTYSVLPHTGAAGNQVNYTWTLGEGQPQSTTTEPTWQITFNAIGIYNLTVTARNNVGSKPNFTTVVVQDEIFILKPEIWKTAAATELHTFPVNITRGSNFTCRWTFGDGSAPRTTDDVTTPVGTANVTHTYTAAGNKTFEVNCTNQVNTIFFTKIQKVQERIRGLNLSRPGQEAELPLVVPWHVSKGTDIEWNVTLDGTEKLDVNTSFSAKYSWQSQSLGASGKEVVYTVSIVAENDINNESITQTYEVMSPVDGLAITASDPQPHAPAEVSFNVTFTKGSNVTVVVTFGDGVTMTLGPWRSGDNVSHVFQDGGVYNVTVVAFNSAGPKMVFLPIKVSMDLSDVDIYPYKNNTNMVLPYTMPKRPVTVTLWVALNKANGSWPTNAVLSLDMGYVHPRQEFPLVGGVNHTETYNEIKSYIITANISNEFGNKSYVLYVRLLEILEDVPRGNSPLTSSAAAVRGKPFTVFLVLLRGPIGTDCTLTWDWDSPYGSHKANRTGVDPYGKDSATMTYNTTGTYVIQVTAVTELENRTHKISVNVVEGIYESDVILTTVSLVWNINSEVTLNLTWIRGDLPASPKIDIYWDVNTSENNITFNTMSMPFKKTYSSAGQRTIRVVVWNAASTIEKNLTVGVFSKSFPPISVTSCYTPPLPVSGPCVAGLRQGRPGVFPSTSTVTFNVNTNNVPALFYNVTAYNGSSSVPYRKNMSSFDLSLQAGNWTVTVVAGNPLAQSPPASIHVTIEPVISNFTFESASKVHQPGVTVTFIVTINPITAPCNLVVDYGDNTVKNYKCKDEKIMHSFDSSGTYLVTATVNDAYNNITRTLSIDISNGECGSPELELENSKANFIDPREYEKGISMTFRVIAKINCTVQENTKTWTIHEVSPDWGNVTCEVNMTKFGVDTSVTELTLKPGSLDYGLYKVTFSMSMNTTRKFTSTAVSYIRVKQSDLVGRMAAGGTVAIEVGTAAGDVLQLTPLDYSFDPDASPPNSAGMNVTSWACTYTNNWVDEKCPDGLTGTLGPAGSLTYNASSLNTSGSYRIVATLAKNPPPLSDVSHLTRREKKATLEVRAQHGSRLHVTIGCGADSLCFPKREGSGFVVVSSARLTLSVNCSTCDTTDGNPVTYLWSVSVPDFRWPYRWRVLQDVEVGSGRSLGITSKEVVILPQFFEAFSGKHNFFSVGCKVIQNGILGWAATTITLNQPPKGGECNISPRSGGASKEKNFHIWCTNWTDETGIDEFQFYSYFRPDFAPVQITTVRSDTGQADVKVSLFPPSECGNQDLTIRVAVRDNMGALSKIDFATVQVTPGDFQNDVSDTSATLLKKDSNNELTRLMEEGDTNKCATDISSVATMLNADKCTRKSASDITTTPRTITTQSQDSSTDASVNQELEKRNTAALVRQELVRLMLKMPSGNTMRRTQVLSAIAETIRVPDEVNQNTQMDVSNAIERFSGTLRDKELITPEEKEQNMRYLVAVSGALIDAAGKSGFKGTLSDLKDIEQDVGLMDYSTDAEVDPTADPCNPPDTTAVASLEAAMDKQKAYAYCLKSKQNAAKMVTQTETVMKNIRETFSNNIIIGEERQLITDRKKVKVKLENAATIISGVHKLNFSETEFEFSKNISDVFPGGAVTANETVMLQMSEDSDTAHRYTPNAINIPRSTKIVTVDFFKDSSKVKVKGMRSPVKIKIPKTGDQTPIIAKDINPTLHDWSQFQIHRTTVTTKGASLHVVLCPQDTSLQYVVVTSLRHVPDTTLGHCHKAFLLSMKDWGAKYPNCSAFYLDNTEINDYVGDIFLGVRELNSTEVIDVSSCTALPKWPNGTVSNDTDHSNSTGFSANYTVRMFSSGCYSISEGEADWSSAGCRVHGDTTETMTVCECTHLTTFAGGWVVVPNTIDWNYVFSNMDFMKNPTLYITEIVIAVAYIFAVILARRKDKKDIEQLGIAPLLDNDPNDRYYYEIAVVTGMRRNAGTQSKVSFILSGDDDETNVRQFSDSKRNIFRRGGTNGFLMAVPRPLGYLNYARIWHDNSGKGANGGWYLNYMIVRDVQTDEKWVFIADRWFAVEEDDGQIDRVIHAATRETMTEFTHLFTERARRNLADGHLWFSVLARPPASRFTRVQRVSCCLCLLYVSMLASAMFYRTDDASSSTSSGGILVGPFRVSQEQIQIGIFSNLLVFPVTLLIITLFRNARARKLRASRLDEAIRTAHDGDGGVTLRDVQPQVMSLFSTKVNPISPVSLSRDESFYRPLSRTSLDSETATAKKKKSRYWPWWCRIVAWFLLWASTLTSAAFVTFYGVSFADETCKKWITSMLMAFFMSVFITQPIKVFLVAIVLSLIIKNPGEEDEEDVALDEEEATLAKDEIPLHDRATSAFKTRMLPPKSLSPAQLRKARDERVKEIRMWAVLREILGYSCFLAVLLLISYRQRNANTFLYKNIMDQVFLKQVYTKYDVHFKEVKNTEDFWNWTRSGLLKGIRAGPYYNDYPPVMLRGYVNDKVSKILGYATMRQLRIRPSECEIDVRMTAVIRECNVAYDIHSQEERAFDVGWRLLLGNETANTAANITANITWYRYTDASLLEGYPYWGQLGVYSGGGYVVPLTGSPGDLKKRMIVLESQNWIDRYTRAVFIEFTTYNPQVNLFGVATILAEFDQEGGAVTSYRFEPAVLLPYMTGSMLFQLVCEGVFCLFILFFIFKLLRQLIAERLAFFKVFWTWIDVGIVGVSLGAVACYLYRLLEANKLTQRCRDSNFQGYIKFQYVAYWNEVFSYMIGWVVFFATIKFLRLLRFNRRIAMLGCTLQNGASHMLHFSVIFWIVFIGFALLFFVTFKNVAANYSSFVRSVVSLLTLMLGKIDIDSLRTAEPTLAQIYVFVFMTSVTFIIVNMFVCILNETFSSVRDDLNKQANDFELVNFMVSRFKRMVGIGAAANESPTTLSPADAQDLQMKRMSPLDDADFQERFDRLLLSFEKIGKY